jgi:hypothetical protein
MNKIDKVIDDYNKLPSRAKGLMSSAFCKQFNLKQQGTFRERLRKKEFLRIELDFIEQELPKYQLVKE